MTPWASPATDEMGEAWPMILREMNAYYVEAGVQMMDAFNRRDVDAFVEPTTADFEWLPALGMAVEGGGFRGEKAWCARSYLDHGEA